MIASVVQLLSSSTSWVSELTQSSEKAMLCMSMQVNMNAHHHSCLPVCRAVNNGETHFLPDKTYRSHAIPVW